MKPRRFEQHRSKSSMMCNRFSDFNVKSDKGKTPLIVQGVLTIDNFLKELGKEMVRL